MDAKDGSTHDASRKGFGGGGGRGGGGGVELIVEQDQSLHNSCGGIVWESAFCLAGYLRRCVRRRCTEPPISRTGGLDACSVLEVGAGCGLLGMSMVVMGARRVVLTDHPDAMPLLRRNVQRNADALRRDDGDGDDDDDVGGDVVAGVSRRSGIHGEDSTPTPSSSSPSSSFARCMPLDWEDDSHLDAVAALGPFDVILATDVVFSVKLVDPLLRCVKACAGPRTVTWVCLQERCPDAFAAFKSR